MFDYLPWFLAGVCLTLLAGARLLSNHYTKRRVPDRRITSKVTRGAQRCKGSQPADRLGSAGG
jgi:hypothetical protein